MLARMVAYLRVSDDHVQAHGTLDAHSGVGGWGDPTSARAECATVFRVLFPFVCFRVDLFKPDILENGQKTL